MQFLYSAFPYQSELKALYILLYKIITPCRPVTTISVLLPGDGSVHRDTFAITHSPHGNNFNKPIGLIG